MVTTARNPRSQNDCRNLLELMGLLNRGIPRPKLTSCCARERQKVFRRLSGTSCFGSSTARDSRKCTNSRDTVTSENLQSEKLQ